MIKEVMNEIATAEHQAEQTVEDAKFQAKHMIDTANKNAEETMAKEIKNQELLAKKKMEEVDKQGSEYTSQIEEETVRERQNILKLAKDNEEGAIDIVIKSLID